MANNNEDQWTDQRLAALDPSGEWKPDAANGLVRLRQRRGRGHGRGRRWLAVVAVGAVTSLGLMAFPASRSFAERCVEFCSAEFSHEALLDLHNWLIGTFLGFLHPGGLHAVAHATPAGKMAPDFTLTDAAGQAVRLSDYKGKVVLLNFWATWCAPCREEIPWFVEFQEKYRDRNFVVLGVSLDDDGWKSVKPFMEAKHMNYPVMLGSGEVGDLYGVKNLPETMIVDTAGRIALNCAGLIGKEEYQAQIEALLKGRVL